MFAFSDVDIILSCVESKSETECWKLWNNNVLLSDNKNALAAKSWIDKEHEKTNYQSCIDFAFFTVPKDLSIFRI